MTEFTHILTGYITRSISFMHAATPVLAPTMSDVPSDPNLDLLP